MSHNHDYNGVTLHPSTCAKCKTLAQELSRQLLTESENHNG